MTELTAEVARALLRYEPETGKLFWRERDSTWFSPSRFSSAEAEARRWNTRWAGKEALASVDTGGYRNGRILGKMRLAHRVVWLIAYGEWPEADIDHINGNRSDNRLSNLRAVPELVNSRNRTKPRNNVSGRVGVYWHKGKQKWAAQIGANMKKENLGDFCTRDEAVAAREAAERRHGYHDNGRQGK